MSKGITHHYCLFHHDLTMLCMNEAYEMDNNRESEIQKVLIDNDVTEIYGVETKRINEAVKNNPDRFPDGYYFEVDKLTKNKLVENFDRFKKMKHSTVSPKAFTEKGLYMLANIIKNKIGNYHYHEN